MAASWMNLSKQKQTLYMKIYYDYIQIQVIYDKYKYVSFYSSEYLSNDAHISSEYLSHDAHIY